MEAPFECIQNGREGLATEVLDPVNTAGCLHIHFDDLSAYEVGSGQPDTRLVQQGPKGLEGLVLCGVEAVGVGLPTLPEVCTELGTGALPAVGTYGGAIGEQDPHVTTSGVLNVALGDDHSTAARADGFEDGTEVDLLASPQVEDTSSPLSVEGLQHGGGIQVVQECAEDSLGSCHHRLRAERSRQGQGEKPAAAAPRNRTNACAPVSRPHCP